MSPYQLRARARQEVEDLGAEPTALPAHRLWAEQRRGAIALLASLADWVRFAYVAPH